MANDKLTIDIEFQSNLNNALKTINKSLEKVDKALDGIQNKRISSPAKGLADGVRRADKEAKKLNRSLSTTANILKGAVVVFAFRQIVNGFNAIGSAAKSAFSQILKGARDSARAEVAFTALLGSTEKAEAALVELTEYAKRTPLDIAGVRESAQFLLNANVEAKRVIPTLDLLAKAAAAGGGNLTEVARNFTQVVSGGRLFTRDFNQFISQGIPILKALADELGVAESKVKGLVEAGKVSSTDVVNAFQRISGEGSKLANVFTDLENTSDGALNALQESLVQLREEIGKSADADLTDLFKSLSSTISQNKDAIISFGKEFIKLAVVVIPKAIKIISSFFGVFLQGINKTIAAWDGLTSLFGKSTARDFKKATEEVDKLDIKLGLARENLERLSKTPYKTRAIAQASNEVDKLQTAYNKALQAQKELQREGFTLEDTKGIDALEGLIKSLKKIAGSKIKTEVEVNVKTKTDSQLSGKAPGGGEQTKIITSTLFDDLKAGFSDFSSDAISNSKSVFDRVKSGVANTFTDLPDKIRDINEDYLEAAKKLKEKEFETEKELIEAENKLKEKFAEKRRIAEEESLNSIKQGLSNVGSSIVSGINVQSSLNKREKQIEQDRLEAIEKLNSTEFKSAKERIAAEKELEDKFAKERASIRAAEQENAEKAAFDTVKTLSSSIADAFSPGLGQLVGIFFDLLRDPEATVEFIRNFVDALPAVIEALIIALPDVALALAEAVAFTVPAAIIRGVARGLAGLFKRLDLEILQPIKEAFSSVERFGQAFDRLIKRLNSFIESITNPGGKGKIGGTLGTVGNFIKNRLPFNKGGFVKGVGTTDTVPAMLTPGELVVDRTTGPKLREFLNSDRAKDSGKPADMGMVEGLLQAILVESQKEQVVNTSIEIDGNILAEAILELSRNNARLS